MDGMSVGPSVCLSLCLFPAEFPEIKRIEPQPSWLVVRGDFCWVCFFSLVLFLAFWSFHLHLMLSKSSLKLFHYVGLKGGRALLMYPPCLVFQGCHLIQHFYLLSCYSV